MFCCKYNINSFWEFEWRIVNLCDIFDLNSLIIYDKYLEFEGVSGWKLFWSYSLIQEIWKTLFYSTNAPCCLVSPFLWMLANSFLFVGKKYYQLDINIYKGGDGIDTNRSQKNYTKSDILWGINNHRNNKITGSDWIHKIRNYIGPHEQF